MKKKSARLPFTTAVAVIAFAGTGLGEAQAGNAGEPVTANGHGHGKEVELRVLSSPPQYVSGGDARIEVRVAPGLHKQVQLFLNGRPIKPALRSDGHRVEGVISGLDDGRNVLEVLVKGRWQRDAINLTNHPITGPMLSGPQQHPFVCTTTQGAVAASRSSRAQRRPARACSTPPAT